MERRTFDFPAALSRNAVCCGAEIRGGGDEVECVFVVLVERNRFLASTQPRSEAFSTVTKNVSAFPHYPIRGEVHTSQQRAPDYLVTLVYADPSA